MSFNAVITRKIVVNGREIEKSQTITVTGQTSLSETIADGQADKLVSLTIDISQVKYCYIVSNTAVTLETNSGAAPADTMVLVANTPYLWVTGDQDAFALAPDVTALYVTNASGAEATLQIEIGYDSTP